METVKDSIIKGEPVYLRVFGPIVQAKQGVQGRLGEIVTAHHPLSRNKRRPGSLQACYLSGSKIKDKDGKPELQILVSYCDAKEALEMYRKSWQVETLFKGLKSSGFDIEGSHVRDRGRMSNLFSIIMIAYVWCYLVGIYIHENIKPIKVQMGSP